MQTRRDSLIETIVGISIGFVVAVISQLIIFPCFDIHIKLSENLQISFYFTVISIIRGYVVRRWFNKRLVRKLTILREQSNVSSI